MAIWSALQTSGKRHIVTTQVEHSAIMNQTDALERMGFGVTRLPVKSDGTLTVVHEDSPYAFSVAQTATTKAGGRTMALDPVTHTIYLVTANIVLGPPAPGETRPTRTITPGTFTLLVMSGP